MDTNNDNKLKVISLDTWLAVITLFDNIERALGFGDSAVCAILTEAVCSRKKGKTTSVS